MYKLLWVYVILISYKQTVGLTIPCKEKWTHTIVYASSRKQKAETSLLTSEQDLKGVLEVGHCRKGALYLLQVFVSSIYFVLDLASVSQSLVLQYSTNINTNILQSLIYPEASNYETWKEVLASMSVDEILYIVLSFIWKLFGSTFWG